MFYLSGCRRGVSRIVVDSFSCDLCSQQAWVKLIETLGREIRKYKDHVRSDTQEICEQNGVTARCEFHVAGSVLTRERCTKKKQDQLKTQTKHVPDIRVPHQRRQK